MASTQVDAGPFRGPGKQTEEPEAPLANELPHQQFHYPVMKKALKALIDNAISVVVFGSQVLYRCGYAEVVILVEWVVPDEQLSLASQVLLKNDYPHFHKKSYAWEKPISLWETQCLMHSLDTKGCMRVHLLPLSLIGFTLDETVPVSSTFDKLHLLTPKPAYYMSSLIHHLLQLPMGHSSRIRVEKDLGDLVSVYILKDGPAHKTRWGYLYDKKSDGDYQKRVEAGIRFMKTWDWSKTEKKVSWHS